MICLSLAVPRTCIHQPQSYPCWLCQAVSHMFVKAPNSHLNLACSIPAHHIIAMDPFSALQVAASIIQCIDVGVRVVERLNEFHNKAGDLPQAFKHIRKRLPVFIETLRHTHLTLENVSESARKALKPAADECLSQIQKLENVIESALPKLDDSSVTKSWKAVVSVKYESDIKDMEKVIKDYMEIFAQYQTSSLALQSFTRWSPKCPNVPAPAS